MRVAFVCHSLFWIFVEQSVILKGFMKNIIYSTFLILIASCSVFAGALLEDFTSSRLNGEGDTLFRAYNTEDPGQLSSIVAGSLKITVPATPAGIGVYMHFNPRSVGGYFWPVSYAQAFNKVGAMDSSYNRLTFLMNIDKTITRRTDGGDNLQFGTYIRKHSFPDAAVQGEHYYHGFDINTVSGKWMKIVINRKPQSKVTIPGSTEMGLDPEWLANGVHYFDGLTRFYFDSQGAGWGSSNTLFDDFYFGTTAGEPDSLISSVTAMYDGAKYQVTWATPKNVAINYEVRYKTSTMKPGAFLTGIDGGLVASTGSSYTGVIWTSCNMTESPSGFCVDIRKQGDTNTTEICIPYQMGPGNSGEAAGVVPGAGSCGG